MASRVFLSCDRYCMMCFVTKLCAMYLTDPTHSSAKATVFLLYIFSAAECEQPSI